MTLAAYQHRLHPTHRVKAKQAVLILAPRRRYQTPGVCHDLHIKESASSPTVAAGPGGPSLACGWMNDFSGSAMTPIHCNPRSD